MARFDLRQSPHRRYNPLTGEWVLVSPHRTRRPWQGQVEHTPGTPALAYDPDCYLCPGNARAGGRRNPEYADTYVFDNDFPALRSDVPAGRTTAGRLILAKAETGVTRVVCFSPRHDLTLATLGPRAIRGVVDVWGAQETSLGAREAIAYVQIFENRGAMMGASNAHPHGQIWACGSLPNAPARELAAQREHRRKCERCLLCDYLSLELTRDERIVLANDHFVALVPFWAVWPYEILLLGKRHAGRIADLEGPERDALVDVLRRIAIRYDNLFETPFPYSMGFHPQPARGRRHPEWHLHAHFYPPLLRSASVRKFMVGFEMLGTPQRDLTAEDAAATLRRLPDAHYLARGRGEHHEHRAQGKSVAHGRG